MSVKRTTHCKYMHPLSGENLYVSPSGKRFCKACKRAYKAAYRLKKGHVPLDQTRCRRGHLFDAENTVIKKSGRRGCRICMAATAKAYNAKRNYDGDNAKRRKPGGLADRHRTAERAAIVAWLRINPDPIVRNWISAQIEAGEHHKDYQVQQQEKVA